VGRNRLSYGKAIIADIWKHGKQLSEFVTQDSLASRGAVNIPESFCGTG
jgi:hypothetical protein